MVAVLVITGLYLFNPFQSREVVLKVFCAGSLTIPMEEIGERLQELHSGITVEIEPSGSVVCIRKVIEQDKLADVVAVSDHRLISTMMFSEHADWYLIFATNQMVLAYTNNSLYSEEVNSTNWYEVLRNPEVKWGFSNPNLDPCGYRSLMVLQLAELFYNDTEIFDDLILDNTAITVSEEGGNYTIMVPEILHPNTARVTVREKSVELVSMLELEGGLDYAFEYLSVAVQHNLSYVMLPPAIDLSDLDYAETYGRVRVVLSSEDVMIGSPITYGVTIPKDAPNQRQAEEFVELMINDFGTEVFSSLGQPPRSPAVTDDLDSLPDRLKDYSVEGAS